MWFALFQTHAGAPGGERTPTFALDSYIRQFYGAEDRGMAESGDAFGLDVRPSPYGSNPDEYSWRNNETGESGTIRRDPLSGGWNVQKRTGPSYR